MKINAVDNNGTIKEYDVILTYFSDEYNKNYVIYTDNIYNDNEELQIYINEYNPKDLECISKSINDNNEYNYIKAKINSILLTMKNENQILDNSN